MNPGKQSARWLVYIALAGLLTYSLIVHLRYLQANVSERDSIAYWTAGYLLVHGQNPYDPAQVLRLEREQGYRESKPLVLRTPPWSLFMVLPLGFVNAFSAWIFWIALSFGSLLLAMRLCWQMYGRGEIPHNIFIVVGYTFAPIPACLVAGQMGLVLLLGVVLFLWWESDHPRLAGAALILPFAKPHLLSLFWLIFVLRILLRRKPAMLAGFVVALAAATAIPWALDPAVFSQYQDMLRQASIGSEFIPAVSGVLRLLFFKRYFWVQFLPLALGLAWCAWFFRRHWAVWDWRRQGLALMVVSVLTTPYSWLTDEVVLLPAILQTAVCVFGMKDSMKFTTRVALTIFACLNGLLLLILFAKVPFATGIYFWSSLVWFAWYLYGQRHCSKATAGGAAEDSAARSHSG